MGAGYQLGDLDIPGGPAAPPRPVPAMREPPRPPVPGAPASSGQNGPALEFAGPDEHGAMDLGGPALELDPVGRRGAGAKLLDFGTRDLSDLDDMLAPSLQLELADALPRARTAEPLQTKTQTKAQAKAKKPLLSTQQAAEAFTHEAQELRDLAGFGDTPAGLVGCARYALQVAVRLFVLRGEQKRVIQTQKAAESEYHRALSKLGLSLMPQENALSFRSLASQFSVVHAAERQVAGTHEALAQVHSETEALLSQLSEKRARAEAELAPKLAHEQSLQEVHKQTGEALRRAQAMEKRVEIELRALAEATAAVDAAKLSALNAQLTQRKHDVAGAIAEAERAQAALGQAQRENAAERRAIQLIAEEERKLSASEQARASQVGKQAQKAGEGRDAALQALAQTATDAGLVDTRSAESQAVAAAALLLDEAQDALDRYARALKLYHRKSVYKGVTLWVVMIVLAVVALYLHRAPAAPDPASSVELSQGG